MNSVRIILISIVFAACATLAGGQSEPPAVAYRFRTDIPAYPGNVIVGRPTDHSIVLNVRFNEPANVQVALARKGEALQLRPEKTALVAGQPREIYINGLQKDAAYEYRIVRADTGDLLLPQDGNGSFHTQRPAGESFTFTIVADSHLDENSDQTLYANVLNLIKKDAPDFHIDLGDTFMTEQVMPDFRAAEKNYLAQRYYLGLVDSPVFLVLGNHDGELGKYLDGTDSSMPIWANTMRKKYFSNPVPDEFYSGNSTPDKFAGKPQDYYSWEWGDALFVALDPCWFTPRPRGATDNWYRTLGREQYDWLKRALEESNAKYKFVFIHNLVGGFTKDGRGGAEAAPYFEWGGKNVDGTEGFAIHRPGWADPIHLLLVKNHVTAVFHGHDHLFAKQELDGIIYQEVPQPADPRGNTRKAAEYSYKSGVILPSPGYLRVTVSPENVLVNFIRPDSTVSHSYTIQAH